MQILSTHNWQPVRFYCYNCWTEFLEDWLKCGQITRREWEDPFCDCDPEDCYHNNVYYTCTCPVCKKTVECSRKDYEKQRDEAYEKWKKQKEENERRQEEDKRIEWHLKETRERRKEWEEESLDILAAYDIFIEGCAAVEKKIDEENEELQRTWGYLYSDVHLLLKENRLAKFERATQALSYKMKKLNITFSDLIRHRNEEKFFRLKKYPDPLVPKDWDYELAIESCRICRRKKWMLEAQTAGRPVR